MIPDFRAQAVWIVVVLCCRISKVGHLHTHTHTHTNTPLKSTCLHIIALQDGGKFKSFLSSLGLTCPVRGFTFKPKWHTELNVYDKLGSSYGFRPQGPSRSLPTLKSGTDSRWNWGPGSATKASCSKGLPPMIPVSRSSVPPPVNPGFHPDVLHSVEITQVPQLTHQRPCSAVDNREISRMARGHVSGLELLSVVLLIQFVLTWYKL
jgi:hypothetical protein